MALPPVGWAAAFAVARSGSPAAGQAVGLGALALSLFAFVFVFEPVGGLAAMQRGRINRSVLRTHAMGGPAECRLDGEHARIVVAGGEPRTCALKELRPPRLVESAAHADLVLVDIYGDPVLHLRGTTPEERRGVAALAEELRRRTPG